MPGNGTFVREDPGGLVLLGYGGCPGGASRHRMGRRRRCVLLGAWSAPRRRRRNQATRATIHRLCSTSTSVGAWRSLVARIVRDDEVGGSNPLAPTNPSRMSAAAWNRAPTARSSRAPRRGAVSCLVFVHRAHGGTSLVPPAIGRTTGDPAVAMPRRSSSAPLIRDSSRPRHKAPVRESLSRLTSSDNRSGRLLACRWDARRRPGTIPATASATASATAVTSRWDRRRRRGQPAAHPTAQSPSSCLR